MLRVISRPPDISQKGKEECGESGSGSKVIGNGIHDTVLKKRLSNSMMKSRYESI